MPEFFKIIGDHTRSIHAEGCCLLASVPPACLIPVTDLRREYSRGYDLCEDCSPLRKMFQAEEEELSAFCSQYHITCKLHNKYLAVQTPRSRWRIALVGGTPATTLYHESTHPAAVEKKFLSKFHLQLISRDSLLSYCKYILFHDDYQVRAENPKAPEMKDFRKPIDRCHYLRRGGKNTARASCGKRRRRTRFPRNAFSPSWTSCRREKHPGRERSRPRHHGIPLPIPSPPAKSPDPNTMSHGELLCA